MAKIIFKYGMALNFVFHFYIHNESKLNVDNLSGLSRGSKQYVQVCKSQMKPSEKTNSV